MTTVNNFSLNVPVERFPLDQLPLEIRSDFMWPYVIANGDHSAASQVCNAFLEAGGYRLLGESNKILRDAENNSGLYSSIKKWVVGPLETRESLCQFHEFIVNKITSLGGGEIAVAHRPLTAEEVRAAHAKLQDRALEKVWPKIASAISVVRPDLVLGRDWKAPEVRIWMKENSEVLLGVQELNFCFADLTMLPVEIGLFAELRELNLSWTDLSEFPAEIYQLKNLTYLNVSDNQLKELPVELGQLTELRELRVSGNEIGELPIEIGQLKNLTDLKVSSNKLRELPDEICQLKNLTFLDISYNPIKKLSAEIEGRENLAIDCSGTPYERSIERIRQFTMAILNFLLFSLPLLTYLYVITNLATDFEER